MVPPGTPGTAGPRSLLIGFFPDMPSDPAAFWIDLFGSLFFSTFLGGRQADWAKGVAVDRQENIYVAGITLSPDFPVQNAFQTSYGGGYGDAFVTKFRPPFYVSFPQGGGYWLPAGLILFHLPGPGE
jgi:Beta-propeller repeat